jgi:CRP/FNR family transcriptional regulator
MLLVAGRVKLSVNSIDGRRLTLAIAEAGDILGLASAVSGCPSQITAEAWFPCRMASLPRQGFLQFLLRHPVAWQNVGRQLSEEQQRSCEQLRNLGIPVTATIKLARLLLDWSTDGWLTDRGIRFQCSMTHEEIGEFIGVARETVSRTLSDFKNRELVHQHGSIMFISNLRGLESYAARLDD